MKLRATLATVVYFALLQSFTFAQTEVTFTVNDDTWRNENIKLKGDNSGWALFDAYDDGTNGDVTADDHIWTARDTVDDGTYSWGAIEDDGSEWGVWLIQGSNPSFTVAGGVITGTVDYVIPPDSAVSAGSVKFTVTDGTESYLDIELKGTMTGWSLVQMYDDGTNGDEVAGDFLWTCIVDSVTAGDHSWGAIENDGTEWGAWLIEGDNPAFTLDSDLLTLHGQTDYAIPAPVGEATIVTFTVTDNSWLNENIKLKGDHSAWALFNAYDDGTNGDVTADDHIWTAIDTVDADGTYSWGAIEDDGSDWGIWLIQGPNPSFTVSAGVVAGAVDYIIPPDSAVSAGSVKFTLTDSTESYLDIEYKGTATDWANVEMYDDGTNGDEVAGDFIWTCIVDGVTAGDHQWGALENDGSINGIWIIEGDNPEFTLDDDLLTLHGQTHYDVPAPLGGEVTKTVLFNIDMTEWLDEPGNLGMAVFSVARGDQMEIRGDFNNWAAGDVMTRTPGTNIFSTAAVVINQPTDENSFTFYMDLTQATMDTLTERYGEVVDWLGWGTSPSVGGNPTFVLGEDDGVNVIELPVYSYYDVFPGSVLPLGESMDVTFTIDMTGAEALDFNAAEDTVYIRTMDKWTNIVQDYSDGLGVSHYPNIGVATPNGDGTYSYTTTFIGPQIWFMPYVWGFWDNSAIAEVLEGGQRIRYLRKDLDNDCEWPSSFSFPLDSAFTLDSPYQETWDSTSICMTLVGIDDPQSALLPSEYHLGDNYPNPFNPSTHIDFSIPEYSDIHVRIFSITGTELYSYSKSDVAAGSYQLTWDGRDSRGNSVPSGLYFYEFQAGNEFRQTKKMLLLK